MSATNASKRRKSVGSRPSEPSQRQIQTFASIIKNSGNSGKKPPVGGSDVEKP